MPPGFKAGGRKKGTPNTVTRDVREEFKRLLERRAPDLEAWLMRVAQGYETQDTVVLKDGTPLDIRRKVKADPGLAVRLLLDAAEYHVPKLARTELTGEGGGALQVEVHNAPKPGETPAEFKPDAEPEFKPDTGVPMKHDEPEGDT